MTWHRTSRQSRGYGRAWELVREQALKRDGYLCQSCLKAGRYVTATAVDHITPKSKGGTDALSNLASICAKCHDAKTLTDSGRKPKTRIGADGWPIEE